MSTKALIEEAQPREPTVQEELAVLGGDDLFDMANLTFDETGITGIVYISTSLGSHGPRVKYFQIAGKTQPSFSVSISENPRVLANSLPERVVNQMSSEVAAWVRANRAELLSFWNDGDSWSVKEVATFLASLKKI